MSAMMSAPLLRFMSKDMTSHPCSLKALPMDPVPLKSSSSLISLPHEKFDSPYIPKNFPEIEVLFVNFP